MFAGIRAHPAPFELRMLDGFASQRHHIGIGVKSLLDALENGFVLPSLEAPLLARCAPMFDDASLTDVRRQST